MALGPKMHHRGPRLEAPRLSLLDTVRRLGLLYEPEDGHWINGVKVEPDFCGEVQLWNDDCVTPPPAKPYDDACVWLSEESDNEFDSFVIWISGKLSTVNPASRQGDLQDRLVRALEVKSHAALELEVQRGQQMTTNINLIDAATVLAGTSFSPVTGIANLEEAWGSAHGGLGMIHIPASLFNLIVYPDLITDETGVLRTPLGNVVVVGSGYQGNVGPGGATGTPSAASPPHSWIYMSPMIEVWRDPQPLVLAEVDHSGPESNTLKVIVERNYMFAHDNCALLAIEIDSTLQP